MRRPLLLLLLALSLLVTPALAAPPEGDGWMRLDAAPLQLHYRAQDAGIASALAEQAPHVLAALESRTGLRPPRVVDVVLTPTWAEFAAAQPGDPPSWAAGTAYAGRSEVYLRTRMPHLGADPIDKVFVHELVHVVLGRAFGDREIPRWLDEGAAKLFAGELSPEDHATLVRAAVGAGLLPLSSITGTWPRNPAKARLAYAQSTDFVAFIEDQREGALQRVIAELASGAELDDALTRATGRSLPDLEDDWRGQMTFWHAWMPIIGGSGVTWGLGAAIFFVAAWRRRRQFHDKVDAMAQREEEQRRRQELMATLLGGWHQDSTPLPGGYHQTVVYSEGRSDDETLH